MGTNYYLRRDGEPDLHIGKSSAGWCFSLHVYPERGPVSLETWIPLLLRGTVYDEYNNETGLSEMLQKISLRSWVPRKNSLPFDYETNHAMPGPNGLARHVVDNFHCIGHGPGPWDLIVGEFS